MINTFGINIIPDNDQERIAVLKRYQILDTAAEDTFDHIAQLAAAIFKVPISLVSLVDAENVFFKANVGMGDATSSSRGVSLCALGILNDITIFEDAPADPCLMANPLVMGDFGLKFYAGAPLVTHDGFNIGTVCVVDKTPRKFSAAEEMILKHLASVVMDSIELRSAALQEIEQQAKFLQEQVIAREKLEQSREYQLISNERLKESNEELAVANEELLASNEELMRAYHHLNTATGLLAESELRFRSIIEQSPIAMMVTTGENLLVQAINPVMLQVLGVNLDLLNKPLFEALPELNNQGFKEKIYEVYRSGMPFYALEAPVKLIKDGKVEYRYFNLAYTPVWQNGKINSVLQVAVEVTEHIKNSEQLKHTEEMFRFAIDAANVGTWRINLKTQEFQSSASLRKLFGYEADVELLLGDTMNRIAETHREAVYEQMDNSIKNGAPFSIDYPIVGLREEQLRWLRAVGKIDQNAAGIPTHFSGVVFEVTEQKQDELRKNDFIAMVSHELKTPLTSLKGYLQILVSKNKASTDSFTRNALEKGSLQVNKMTALIDGFLNLSQMEAGKIYLKKADFHLNDLITEIAEEAKLLTPSHLISVVEGAAITVHADREKIGQVMNNFISNAIKYSPAGTMITLNCTEDEDFVELSVKDEGEGIKPDDCKKLFDRFYRVENAAHLSISGFGIGLYICSEIINRHQGKIWVESCKGEGATFFFRIPRYQFPD